MPTALRKGLKIQSGFETVWGTSVAATAIRAALNDIRYRPGDTLQERDELNGLLTKATGSADVLGTSGLVTEGGFMTYQDWLYLMEAGYKTAAPSADAGTPIAYTRTYQPTLTTDDSPRSATLEAGGLTEAFKFPGGFVASYQFTAAMKGYTMYSANWLAKDMISATFTAALTRRTVTRALSQLWTVSIDTSWANLGNTPVTSCLTNIAFNSGPLYGFTNCINGQTTPVGVIQETAQQPSVVLTFKLDAATLALFTDYRAGTTKYLRLKNVGATAIHGTPNVFPTIQYDLAANMMAWPDVGQAVAEGALTIPITFNGTFDPTGAAQLKIVSISSLATLP